MKPIVALLAGLFLIVAARMAWAAPPSISFISPAAVAPGAETDVTLHGAGLASPTGIWTGFPAVTSLTPGLAANGTQADQVTYHFRVPPEVGVGIWGMRVATGSGVTPMRLIMTDDLPSVADAGNNKTLATAQPVSLPAAIDGACEAEQVDCYRFTAAAGQRISVEAVARRLGSALDPVIRLLDAAGKELAYSDDEPGLGPDGRFAYRVPTAGDYFIEIRDIRYQGGPTHRYRLRLGDFPLATACFPMAAAVNTTPKLELVGPGVQSAIAPLVSIPAAGVGALLRLSAKQPDGRGSAAVTLLGSNLLEQVEIEGNNTPETATPCTIPGAINGRFDVPQDRDYYEFTAKKGQHLLLVGSTRRLGSPSDLFMRLFKADGSQVAEVEDTGTEEGTIDFNCTADGVYRLMVEDLTRRGGPEHVYRIEARPFQAGFSLTLDGEKYDAPKAGVVAMKVTSVRRAYNGPITLGIDGLGEGTTLAANVIPEGKNETTMLVTVPSAVPSGSLNQVHVFGTAKIGEAQVKESASTLVPLRTALNGLAYPPEDLDGIVGLGVGPVFPDFFQLNVPTGIVLPQLIGAGSFKITATRSGGFDGDIALTVDGLPPGVAAKAAPIAKGQTEVAIALAGPPSLALGEYPIHIVGSATHQNQPKQVTVATAKLRVATPLELTVAPAGPLAPGAKQTVKVTVARYGDVKSAIQLKLAALPTGVTGPADFAIAEGQNEASVELNAAADAPLGPTPIAVLGTAKVKDRELKFASAKVNLEIKKP